MNDRVQLLIDVLLDKTARVDERDDAAIDLQKYKDLRALHALMKIASDPNEDRMIIDSCIESISGLCATMNYFDEESFEKLILYAQKDVFEYIMARNPTLIKPPLRD